MDELSGQGELRDLLEARRRIVAAFEEIAAGAEALALACEAQPGDASGRWSPDLPADEPEPADLADLRAELEEERMANAQLMERVSVLRGRHDGRLAELDDSLAAARARIAALESARAAERHEIDAVLAELIPLVEEAG